MNLNRLLWGLLFIAFSIYCKQGLCQEELKVAFHKDTIENCIKSYEYTVIIYVKPVGCISCVMSNLINPWEMYKKTLAK
jgi:ABC-type antimicrobial peptide transport system permease subunit